MTIQKLHDVHTGTTIASHNVIGDYSKWPRPTSAPRGALAKVAAVVFGMMVFAHCLAPMMA